MKTLTTKDLQTLSAYLDGALSPRASRRLEARLAQEPALQQTLDELAWTRQVLRRAPKRRAPRSFVLSPRMAGVRAPVPPLARWSQLAAMLALVLLFFVQAGGGLPGNMPVAEAPIEEAAPLIVPTYREAASTSAEGDEMPPEKDAPAAAPLMAEEQAASPVADETPTGLMPEPGENGMFGQVVLLGVALLAGGLSIVLRYNAHRRLHASG